MFFCHYNFLMFNFSVQAYSTYVVPAEKVQAFLQGHVSVGKHHALTELTPVDVRLALWTKTRWSVI